MQVLKWQVKTGKCWILRLNHHTKITSVNNFWFWKPLSFCPWVPHFSLLNINLWPTKYKVTIWNLNPVNLCHEKDHLKEQGSGHFCWSHIKWSPSCGLALDVICCLFCNTFFFLLYPCTRVTSVKYLTSLEFLKSWFLTRHVFERTDCRSRARCCPFNYIFSNLLKEIYCLFSCL